MMRNGPNRDKVMALPMAAFWLALAAGAPLFAADRQSYIGVYNQLVEMVNNRSAVSQAPPFPKKQPGDSITQGELCALRSQLITISGRFVRPIAMPNGEMSYGASFMVDVGDGQGQWTRIPGEFTASGQSQYSSYFASGPILWVHFEEIAKVVSRITTLGIPMMDSSGPGPRLEARWYYKESRPCVWSYDWASSFAMHRNAVENPDNLGWSGPVRANVNIYPRCMTVDWWEPPYCRVHEGYRIGRLVVANISTNFNHTIDFYNCATRPTHAEYGWWEDVWNSCGAAVSENAWTKWDTAASSLGAAYTSAVLGSCAVPYPAENPPPSYYLNLARLFHASPSVPLCAALCVQEVSCTASPIWLRGL
ncbi:MAG: hypothetical protein QME60_05925 [Verrucomicrobiota bacterium]|nr:hypothetical protein [Verrucomicrobiota bacterium]